MTSETNRPDPILPSGPSAAINADDATQSAFPSLTPQAADPWSAPTTPGASSATPRTETSAVPTWAGTAQPVPAQPFGPPPASPWATAEPAASYAPPVSPAPAPGWTGAPAAAYTPKPHRTQRGVTPVVLAVAIVATAVLTAGTTYVAVEATHPAASQAANQLTAAQPSAGTGQSGSNGQSGQGSTATQTPANPVPANGQASIPDIVKAVSPAVVTITAQGVTSTNQLGQSGTGTAVGSGVIFDASGLVLTNHHVVAGNPSKLTVTLKDGRTLNASIYGIDTLTDLAVVKLEGASNLPTAPIGSSAGIQVGQQSIAIGSPLGDLTGSVTSGIISAIGREITAESETLDNLIQTDTPINPGNSGGPLLDAGGNVIGINTAVSTDAQNIGFAIPIDIAKPLLAQASAGQPLARAWLGVRFKTIDPTLQSEAKLPVANGAWIPSAAALEQLQNQSGQGATGNGNGQNPQGNGNGQNPQGNGFGQGNGNGSGSNGSGNGSGSASSAIVADSPASKAGLAEGDIITAINGTTLDATHTLDLLLGQHKPGEQVTLSVLRSGQTSSVTVTLGTRPQSV